jgi:hypothetical protein
MAALQPTLLPRFATTAVLFAVSLHVIVGWIEPRREELRWRRVIGFSYQVNQIIRRSPLYCVGGIREDTLLYLHRLVDSLGSPSDVSPDFTGFAIVAGDQFEEMSRLRNIQSLRYDRQGRLQRLRAPLLLSAEARQRRCCRRKTSHPTRLKREQSHHSFIALDLCLLDQRLPAARERDDRVSPAR